MATEIGIQNNFLLAENCVTAKWIQAGTGKITFYQ